MTRAVVDAGVLIAGLISVSGAPAGLLEEMSEGRIDVVVCPMLLAEIRRALSYPRLARYVDADEADAFVSWVARFAITVADPSRIVPVTRDADDEYLFALAIEAGADVVVSGDADVLQAEQPPVPISTARTFVDALSPKG